MSQSTRACQKHDETPSGIRGREGKREREGLKFNYCKIDRPRILIFNIQLSCL